MAMLLAVVGTAMSVMGSIQQGKAANAAAKYNAAQQEKQGNLEFASKQRESLLKTREGQLAESRAQALAAASGAGGMNTPSVNQTIAEIAKTADYNASSYVFEGQAMKDSRYDQAALMRAQGKAAYKGSILQGMASGISGMGKAIYG